MPELPEVETTVKGLSVILSQKISNVKIHTSKLRFKIPNNMFVLHNLMRTYQIPGILGQNSDFRLKMQFLRVSENIYLRSRFLET